MSSYGQSPSEMPNAPSHAAQVPLSGRQPDAGQVVFTQRTTNSGGGSTVNVIDSSVMTQGVYSGSETTGKANGETIPLTLESALVMGLRENLGALSQSAGVEMSKGQREVARSELLPQVNTVVSEAFEKINIRTLGVEENSFPLTSKFNFYDARAARLNQTVFDLVKIRNLHSASENVQATLKSVRNARDLIVLAVGGSYLQLLATKARIEAAAVQVESFRAVYKQAADRLEAGLATRVDVTRSQVQMQTEQQRLRSLQADLETQKLKFARIIGLPAGQQFDASDGYQFAEQTMFTQEQALAKAQTDRTDLQAAEAGLRSAEMSVKAAHAERLPSLAVTGDFGAAGITPSYHSAGVFNVSGTLTVPLYEGGRIHGEIEEANAAVRQRKAEVSDLHAQVDTDVRQAFIDMGSAADQVGVAESNQKLARETLTQSRDRFAAGITDTVEVVQAEQMVVQADDDFISAVFEHNLAKVSLARAIGNAEQTIPQLLRKQ